MPYKESIPGFMNVDSLIVLEKLAGKVPRNGIIAEVGSFMGRSAWTFAKSADPSVSVYCIDIWDDKILEPLSKRTNLDAPQNDIAYDFDQFMEFVKDCPNIIPLRGRSTEVPWEGDKGIDLVFIDGSHASPDVDNDIATWMPRLKPGGVLAGHDFNAYTFPDVCKAVVEVAERMDLPIKFYKNSTIWVIEMQPSVAEEPGVYISTPLILERIKETLEEERQLKF